MQNKKIPRHVRKNLRSGGFSSTVGSTIARVLPRGTLQIKEDKISWINLPLAQEDVFAVTGVLLEESGAFSFFGINTHKSYLDFPKLSIPMREMEMLEKLGGRWVNTSSEPPREILSYWEGLISYWDFPLNYEAYKIEGAKRRNEQYWWKSAYKLFVVSDTACQDIGFAPRASHRKAKDKARATEYWRQTLRNIKRKKTKIDKELSLQLPSTLAPTADADIVSVQPKSLVPEVGAGTRVFSRNLSLIRGRGIVRTQWIVNTHVAKPNDDDGLNILTIPFPYSIDRDEFAARNLEDPVSGDRVSVFELQQKWLNDEPFDHFRDVATGLIRNCRVDLKKEVHAIILPELALNRKRFLEFCDLAKILAPEIEFIISGTSENCAENPRRGNYIWIRRYNTGGNSDQLRASDYVNVVQSKHHRWNLNTSQISSYSLSMGIDGGLNPGPHWENFAGRPREVNFFAFRERSAFCGIICEDLARSEPCHEIIKSVGPNLIFVLLMDGPQIEKRWGARYSSLFAADPGSAVLTVNSLGLIKLSQSGRGDDADHSVLYFNSPMMKSAASFECKEDDTGIFVRLVPDLSRGLVDPTYRTRQIIDKRKKDVVNWVIDPNFDPSIIYGGR